MKLSNLISKFHQTFARVFLAFNLFDSLFPHHATKLKQNHQVNLKNSEPTQSKNDAAQVQFEVLETGVMKCWRPGKTGGYAAFEADLMLPQIAKIILVKKPLIDAETKLGKKHFPGVCTCPATAASPCCTTCSRSHSIGATFTSTVS